MIEKKVKELSEICSKKMENVSVKDIIDILNKDEHDCFSSMLPNILEKQEDFFYAGNPQTDFFNGVHSFMKESGIPYEFLFIAYTYDYEQEFLETTYVLSWYEDGNIHILTPKFETGN